MTPDQLTQFRKLLREYSTRLRRDASSVARSALGQTGGQADGGLSNAPLHIADMGTETYLQELSATLLENEEFLVNEVSAAMQRIGQGTFGQCEKCDQPIAKARLQAIPFSRHCTACAAAETSGPPVNLNVGRPGGNGERESTRRQRPPVRGDNPPADVHAAGTPAGGTAFGGLAGTNVGHGDPDDVPLEAAAGSSQAEMRRSRQKGAPSGGRAVAGTPASKRAGTRKPSRAKRRRQRSH